MKDENVDLSFNEDNNNVLKYIYMLKDHLENLSLIWRGLSKDKNGNIIRVSEPYSCDSFIFEQINVLSSVLNPHNFVSNIDNDERNTIILDTYASFLYSMNREPTITKRKKPMMQESFFNTLMLFLNILKGGAGAQFTLGAQTGVTMDIYKSNRENSLKPVIDIPRAFGFGNKQKQNIYSQNNYNQIQDEDKEI